jgi:hypothetical protein
MDCMPERLKQQGMAAEEDIAALGAGLTDMTFLKASIYSNWSAQSAMQIKPRPL